MVDDVIGLGPYTIPVFYCVSVLIRPLVDPPYILYFDLFVGFTFGLHAIGNIREIWRNWTCRTFVAACSGVERKTDIAHRGFVFSIIYIVTVNLAIHGFLLSVLVKGYPGILSWATVIWGVTKNIMIAIANGLLTVISDQMKSFLR